MTFSRTAPNESHYKFIELAVKSWWVTLNYPSVLLLLAQDNAWPPIMHRAPLCNRASFSHRAQIPPPRAIFFLHALTVRALPSLCPLPPHSRWLLLPESRSARLLFLLKRRFSPHWCQVFAQWFAESLGFFYNVVFILKYEVPWAHCDDLVLCEWNWMVLSTTLNTLVYSVTDMLFLLNFVRFLKLFYFCH